jgi:hypothetical protein
MALTRKLRTVGMVIGTFGYREITRIIIRKFYNFFVWRDKDSDPLEISGLQIISTHIQINKFFLLNYNDTHEEILLFHKILDDSLPSLKLKRKGFFDSRYDIGELALFCIYQILSHTNTRLVLETGVAAGKSTAFILRNFLNTEVEGRTSKLVSTDITVNCGELIPEDLKKYWTFEKLSGNIKKQFIDVVKKHREIELFIHDSNHTAKWEMFELLTVLKYCENLRYIIVDDVQVNVVHKLRNLDWKACLLKDGEKISLLAIKNQLA